MSSWIERVRRPVRREGAERFVLLMLVSFAATVILTRFFLEMTGFPRLGGGELHIAHALWGGLLLFVASLLPILFAGRAVYALVGLVSGAGIGLFIDEVGKFITTRNDYLYPAAAPLIYATFLLVVLVYLQARRAGPEDARGRLIAALEQLEEIVEHDLQADELEALAAKLDAVVAEVPEGEQRRLAEHLRDFLRHEQLVVAGDRRTLRDRALAIWRARRDRWIGQRGARLVLIGALLASGLNAIVTLGLIALQVAGPELELRLFALNFVHLVVEGIAGSLLLAGGALLAARRERLGLRLALYGVLVALTLGDLLAFYLRQFESVTAVLFHFVLLTGLVAYDEGEEAAARSDEYHGSAEVP